MQFGIFKWCGVKRKIAIKMNKSDKVFLNSQNGDFLLPFFHKVALQKVGFSACCTQPVQGIVVFWGTGRAPPHADVAPLTFYPPS